MSDGFVGEPKRFRQSSSWRLYDFSEEQCQAFISHLEPDIGITDRYEIGGGLSGARTFSVRIDPGHSSNARVRRGQYILKVCLSDKAEQEIQNHTKAKKSSTLGRYVPDLVDDISFDDMPLTAILYKVAGGNDLTRTTLQNGLEAYYYPLRQVEKLASVILRWNLEATLPSRTPDLLRSIGKGMGKDHLQSLEDRLGRIAKHLDRPRIDLGPLMVWRYNPVHFLLSQEPLTPLRQMRYVIPEGTLHGDLHPANIIIPTRDHPGGTFNVIDFASSRPGNAFFDLAYLEISILLNLRISFDNMEDLEYWWELQEYLSSEPLPSEKGFTVTREGPRFALPIRRALYQRMQQDSSESDYWVAFLAASVEAGLDLARKVHPDPSRQRVAFLTAVSRFHHLVKLLKAIERPTMDAQATIYWPGEKPRPINQGGGMKEGVSIPEPLVLAHAQEEKAKIELAWPGVITQRGALYDPWTMVDAIWVDLAGKNDQGVLLIGERKFGKSSFFNSVGSLFPRDGGNLKSVRLDILNTHPSAQSFASELLGKMCRRVGLPKSPAPYDSTTKDFDIHSFLSACESVVEENEGIRFVVCVDEIDSISSEAPSTEDCKAILHLLYKLLTDPALPIRLMLTATDTGVLRRYVEGANLLDNLGIWTIPLCSEAQMRDLIERFDAPVTFEDEALNRIFFYSGGQIYLVKLAVKAGIAQTSEKDGKKRINAQLVDDLMHAVIEPYSSTFFEITNLHDAVLPTMSNIYEKHFSDDEQRLMKLLAEAEGVLRTSSSEVNKAQFANIANTLYRRGYLSKTGDDGNEMYSWRIGLWQLFLENRYQLKYRKS